MQLQYIVFQRIIGYCDFDMIRLETVIIMGCAVGECIVILGDIV